MHNYNEIILYNVVNQLPKFKTGKLSSQPILVCNPTTN